MRRVVQEGKEVLDRLKKVRDLWSQPLPWPMEQALEPVCSSIQPTDD